MNTITQTNTAVTEFNPAVTAALSTAANATAQQHVFADYTSRKAANTVKAQLGDLKVFCAFLSEVGQDSLKADALQAEPAAWGGVEWGLVEAFVKWQLRNEYSIGSINRRLSTIKTYAKLAAKAGTITAQDLAMIKTVSGYGLGEGANINEARQADGLDTNKGRKKAESVTISEAQAKLLKAQPDTPQGRRDAILMILLLDHGLRASELATLRVSDINLDDGVMIFTRPKVKGTDKAIGRHKLTADAQRALQAWFSSGDVPAFADAPLLRGSRKGGNLTDAGMSTVSISDRVRTLAASIEPLNLSAHDCRHYTATTMAKRGYSVNELCDWFGWNSPSMAIRYIDSADVAERDKG